MDAPAREAPKLSVIIPLCGFEPGLAATLAALRPGRESGLVGEIILAHADAPADPETTFSPEAPGALAALAASEAARLLPCESGRGLQLAQGAQAASGAWLLFLHGDTLLDAGWERHLAAFMADSESGSGAQSGRRDCAAYFRLAFDEPGPAAAVLASLANWRARFLGLPYGDQALAIRADFYRKLGGFRPLPLMEDVDIVRRIGRSRITALPVRAITSARRYRRDGWLRRPLRNALLLGLYFLGVPPRRLVRLYG